MNPSGAVENRYGVVEAALKERSIRETLLEVIRNPYPSIIGAPGSVSVFLCRKGSSGLSRVRAALDSEENARAFVASLGHDALQIKSEPPANLKETLGDVMARQPVLADIAYAGVTLNRGIFLPEGLNILPVLLAYSGGRLGQGGLALVEHFVDASAPGIEGIAISTEPKLTAAEEAVLKLSFDSGASPDVLKVECDTTYWAAALFTAGIATALGTGVFAVFVAATAAIVVEPVHLSQNEIRLLGPHASVDQLLRIRKEALSTAIRRSLSMNLL